MMNNQNFNLASKLFAYVQQGAQLTPAMAEQYKSSLIFIGDEQQIYVPIKNAYVGIGATAYSNLKETVAELQKEVASLENGAAGMSVKRIYVGVGPYSYQAHIAEDTFLETSLTGDDLEYMTGAVEISGVGDYDASTGFAYNTYWMPLANGGFKRTHTWNNTSTKYNATSGITISYFSEYDTAIDPNTGVEFSVPGKQCLVIDDSKTWAYMTAAYTYAMGFTKEYTNQQINQMYKDLLGETNIHVMVPIDESRVTTIDPTTGDVVWAPTETIYAYNGDIANAVMSWTGDNSTPPQGWVEQNHYEFGTQYYVADHETSSSYNMNLANGIQTLKEVAYILDKLSDGALGSVTYITRDQWHDLGGNDAALVKGTTYRIITNGQPTTNPNAYAYTIVEADPDNLGIQMASSIAGNTADIQDLHYHIGLAENGQTSVRSIAADATGMVNVKVFGNRQFVTTDTGYTLPSVNSNWMSSYSIGDTRMFIDLDLASTYVTLSTNDSQERNIDGVTFWGLRQKADAFDIAGKSTSTYYKSATGDALWSGDSIIGSTFPEFGEELLKLVNDQDKGVYYVGQSQTYTYVNDKFGEITSEADFTTYKDNGKQLFTLSNSRFSPVTDNAAAWVNNGGTSYYVMTNDTTPTYVHHAVTGENKIATTAWTLALLNDLNIDTSGGNDTASIRNYVDMQIAYLDTKLAYSDFSWDNPNHAVPGTSTYINEFNEARNTWYVTSTSNLTSETNGWHITEKAQFGYVFNRVRSQYISNIEEEDGIIKVTETKELPVDQISISTSIWGNQDAEFNKTFVKVANLPAGSGVFSSNEMLDKLFSLAEAQPDHQVYYRDTVGLVYQKAIAGQITPTSGTYYKLDTATGEYKLVLSNAIELWHYNSYTASTSSYWVQIYEKVPAYYEIDLATVNMDMPSRTYLGTFSYGKYDANGDVASYIAQHAKTPDLYVVSPVSQLSYSTKYITGTVQHFSYTEQGGEGQNRFNLTTHITHIEDASPVNTGLADAWDVASFIENLCEWVDLSGIMQ